MGNQFNASQDPNYREANLKVTVLENGLLAIASNLVAMASVGLHLLSNSLFVRIGL